PYDGSTPPRILTHARRAARRRDAIRSGRLAARGTRTTGAAGASATAARRWWWPEIHRQRGHRLVGSLESGHFPLRQPESDRLDRVLQVRSLGGTYDRRADTGLREQPRDGHLRRAYPAFTRNGAHRIDHGLVRLAIETVTGHDRMRADRPRTPAARQQSAPDG